MEKLNELAYRAKGYLRTKAEGQPAQINVSCETILAIAEAFQALEKRAVAAEAKLATKEQELAQYVECFEAESARADLNHAKLAELADLVPREAPKDVYRVIYQQCGGFVDSEANAQTIWTCCRAAILRNIEEAK